MRGSPTRETCAICDGIIICGFKVSDELWRAVLKPFYQNSCICLNCFARHADEKSLAWERDIQLYPMSKRTNLARTRSPIVCLCGSTRFIERMAVEAWKLEKAGCIVLSCHLLPWWYTRRTSHQAEAEGCAAQLDALHLRKIDIANRVRIINVGGYIGESTRNEINYAESIGKPITYLEQQEQSA